MSSLKVSYDGGQHATAVNEPHHNVVAIDCPFTGKGEEFSPGSLRVGEVFRAHRDHGVESR